MSNSNEGQLQRGLKSRHLVMIAIGGAIADGLFLSTGATLSIGGSGGALFAYLFIAFMVYFMITSLGEMATYLPVSGSFATYSTKYVKPSFGFAIGWNYWFCWAICIAICLVAAGIVMGYWFPNVPILVWCAVFFFIILAINLTSAKVYGESEYWMASIKVFAVIAFIITGFLMMFGVVGNPPSQGMSNFTSGGLFPNGLAGVVAVINIAIYSFVGTELIGIAAGESENPEKSIPKAVKTVFWRIVIFYVLSIFVLASILPWSDASVLVSPFTKVFNYAGIPYADSIMNIVVLTAILSSANSSLYAASRMLFAMSKEGKAPKIFGKTDKRGLPLNAILVTAVLGVLAVLLKFMGAGEAYLILVNIISLSIVFCWISIAVSHLGFRKWMKEKGLNVSDLKYKSILFPFGPILTIVVCLFGIFSAFVNPGSRITFLLGTPVFIASWLIGIYLERKGVLIKPSDEDLRSQANEQTA
jgi:lysine-specific permease